MRDAHATVSEGRRRDEAVPRPRHALEAPQRLGWQASEDLLNDLVGQRGGGGGLDPLGARRGSHGCGFHQLLLR